MCVCVCVRVCVCVCVYLKVAESILITFFRLRGVNNFHQLQFQELYSRWGSTCPIAEKNRVEFIILISIDLSDFQTGQI